MNIRVMPGTREQDLADLASQINDEHAACVRSANDAVKRAIEVGRLLVRAKQAVPHGDFTVWVKANCTFRPRMAQRYMQSFHDRNRLDSQMRNGSAHLGGMQGDVINDTCSQAADKPAKTLPSQDRRFKQSRPAMAPSRGENPTATVPALAAPRSSEGAPKKDHGGATIDGEFLMDEPEIPFVMEVSVTEEDRAAHLKCVKGEKPSSIVVFQVGGHVSFEVEFEEGRIQLAIPNRTAIRLARQILRVAGEGGRS
jgi:hypothetical protein